MLLLLHMLVDDQIDNTHLDLHDAEVVVVGDIQLADVDVVAAVGIDIVVVDAAVEFEDSQLPASLVADETLAPHLHPHHLHPLPSYPATLETQ